VKELVPVFEIIVLELPIAIIPESFDELEPIIFGREVDSMRTDSFFGKRRSQESLRWWTASPYFHIENSKAVR